ncbi:hypothetical protein PY730_27865 (plasmid) [Klebsiella pneumoniae]|nr:hypothetical protein PY730_27865 [Klebsiella pneumoniae]
MAMDGNMISSGWGMPNRTIAKGNGNKINGSGITYTFASAQRDFEGEMRFALADFTM